MKPKSNTVGEKQNHYWTLAHEVKRLRAAVTEISDETEERKLFQKALHAIQTEADRIRRIRLKWERTTGITCKSKCPACGFNLLIVDELNQVLPKSKEPQEPEQTQSADEACEPDVQVVASLKL